MVSAPEFGATRVLRGAQARFEAGGQPPSNEEGLGMPTEPQDGDGPTVLQLFTHTAGIMSGTTAPEARTLAEYSEQTAALPLLFKPGSQFCYGEGISILGRLIEIWSGEPYEEFLQREVFDAIGMADATFRLSDGNRHRLVTQHRVDDAGLTPLPEHDAAGPYIPEANGPEGLFPGPSGGVAATIEDYYSFLAMLCSGGLAGNGRRVLASSTVALLGSNHLPAASGGRGADCGDLANPEDSGHYGLVNPGCAALPLSAFACARPCRLDCCVCREGSAEHCCDSQQARDWLRLGGCCDCGSDQDAGPALARRVLLDGGEQHSLLSLGIPAAGWL